MPTSSLVTHSWRTVLAEVEGALGGGQSDIGRLPNHSNTVAFVAHYGDFS
jgi:hypothetical protein